MRRVDVFEKRVLPRLMFRSDGCFVFPHGDNGNGYRYVKVRPNTYAVHRLAYSVLVGEIKTGLSVLHKCDNRSCCNPDHLFLGTQADNVKDMDSKGRRGTWSPAGNLNPAKRDDVKAKISVASFAREKRKREAKACETDQ